MDTRHRLGTYTLMLLNIYYTIIQIFGNFHNKFNTTPFGNVWTSSFSMIEICMKDRQSSAATKSTPY